ncbi:MAG: UDP-N-acetylmuramoyl-L-alanine--D-glutamate ligase [Thiotrichales bacterium]
MKFSHLAGKKIAILGFGQEGKAALDLLAADRALDAVTVLDEKPWPAREEKLERSGRSFILRSGKGVFQGLANYNVLLKSPGISSYRPEIQAAIKAGSTLTSGTQLWFDKHAGEKIVIVTGTKGKSTSASLLAHLLRHGKITTGLIGNIGEPALAQMSVNPLPDVWVVELSSYQMRELKADPSAAILLNLYPEHTDWHQSTENYYHDKTRLFTEMRSGVAILNAEDSNTSAVVSPPPHITCFNDPAGIHLQNDFIMDGRQPLIAIDDIPLRGTHNLKNLCAVLTAIKVLGYPLHPLLEGVDSFTGLPHRLQHLGKIKGIDYIDDSISTTPQSTMAALNAYYHQPVTLLTGGYDRELDWSEFARAAQRTSLRTLITMPDNGRKIASAARTSGLTIKIIETAGLEEAVTAAQEHTSPGGAIILSPGAPSYGIFKNYMERGMRFAELINQATQ